MWRPSAIARCAAFDAAALTAQGVLPPNPNDRLPGRGPGYRHRGSDGMSRTTERWSWNRIASIPGAEAAALLGGVSHVAWGGAVQNCAFVPLLTGPGKGRSGLEGVPILRVASATVRRATISEATFTAYRVFPPNPNDRLPGHGPVYRVEVRSMVQIGTGSPCGILASEISRGKLKRDGFRAWLGYGCPWYVPDMGRVPRQACSGWKYEDAVKGWPCTPNYPACAPI
jgi:hypothetical protein